MPRPRFGSAMSTLPFAEAVSSAVAMTVPRSVIVTVPVGYGDGFPRALSSRGQVLLRGQRHPLVGPPWQPC